MFEDGFEGDHISREKFASCLDTFAAGNFNVDGLEQLHQMGVTEATTEELKQEIFKSFMKAMQPLAHQLYDFFDKDGDGKVSRNEVNLTCSTFQGHPDGMADSLFKLIDRNNNGSVEPAELASFVKGLLCAICQWMNAVVDLLDQFAGQPLVKSLIDQGFLALDQDGDGKLCKEEVGAAFLPMYQMYQDLFESGPSQIKQHLKNLKEHLDKGMLKFDQECGDSDGLDLEAYIALSKTFYEEQCTEGGMLTSEKIAAQNPELPPPVTAAIASSLPKVMAAIPERLAGCYKAWFKLLDINKDGVLSKSEYKTMCEALLPSGDHQTKIDDLFAAVDTDGDGFVSREEATTFAESLLACVLKFVHMCIDMYGFITEEVILTLGTAVIENSSVDNAITLGAVKQLVAQGPEHLLALTVLPET